MKINGEMKSFEEKNGDQLLGILYFETDQGAFPDEDWSDFCIDCLYEWVDQLYSLLRFKLDEAELMFMDGSPALFVKTADGHAFSYGAYFRGIDYEREPDLSGVFDIALFLESCRRYLEKIEQEIELFRICSSHRKKIARIVSKLKRLEKMDI